MPLSCMYTSPTLLGAGPPFSPVRDLTVRTKTTELSTGLEFLQRSARVSSIRGCFKDLSKAGDEYLVRQRSERERRRK